MRSKIQTFFTALLASALALVAYSPPPAHAQTVLPFLYGDPAPAAFPSAEDGGIAFIIKHVGTGASGTAQISSGDLLLKDGAEGAEAATTDITGCGGTAGTLDVDNAGCDTLGELIDRINASAKWRAVIIDGLRSDVTAAATLLTKSATAATAEAGLAINWDTSVAFHETRCLGCTRSIAPYLSTGSGSVAARLVPNPFAGRRVILFYWDATSTYGSGTSQLQVISVKVNNSTGGGTESTNLPNTTGTGGLVYTIAGGATTVNKVAFNQPYGLRCEKDAKCLVRISNSAAASVTTIQAYASIYTYRGVEGVGP